MRESQAALRPNELLIAYLDDIYIVTRPERAREAYELVTRIVREHCGIEPNLGKTVCWNRSGVEPIGMSQLGDDVWRGGRSDDDSGIRVLGAPIGRAGFMRQFGV